MLSSSIILIVQVSENQCDFMPWKSIIEVKSAQENDGEEKKLTFAHGFY